MHDGERKKKKKEKKEDESRCLYINAWLCADFEIALIFCYGLSPNTSGLVIFNRSSD